MSHATVPESGNAKEPWSWIRRIAMAVNGLLLGKSNNVSTLTLTASATTTTITNARITPDTMAVLEPTTASAVTARATLRQSAAPGVITLTHANTADADKAFRVALIG